MAERLWIWRRVATLKMKRLSKPQSLQWEQEIRSAREPFFTACVSEFPKEGSSSHPFVFSAPWSFLLCDGHWLLGNKTERTQRKKDAIKASVIAYPSILCATHLPYQYSRSHSVIKRILYWPRHRLEIQFVLFGKKPSFESLAKVFVWNSSEVPAVKAKSTYASSNLPAASNKSPFCCFPGYCVSTV